jgi:hypothetical protein
MSDARTLADLMAAGADDDVALTAPGVAALSFAALRALVRDTVAALNATGIGRGDRVAAFGQGERRIHNVQCPLHNDTADLMGGNMVVIAFQDPFKVLSAVFQSLRLRRKSSVVSQKPCGV